MRIMPVLLLLCGCATPSAFDNELYSQLVSISVNVERAVDKCVAPTFVDTFTELDYKSKVLVRYTESASTDMHTAIVIIDKDITKLVTAEKVQPPPSKSYCQLMLKTIDGEIKAVLPIAGGKK